MRNTKQNCFWHSSASPRNDKQCSAKQCFANKTNKCLAGFASRSDLFRDKARLTKHRGKVNQRHLILETMYTTMWLEIDCWLTVSHMFRKKLDSRIKQCLAHSRFIVCVTPKQKENIAWFENQVLAEHVRKSQSTIYLKSHGCVHGFQNEVSLINFSTMFCKPCSLSRNRSLRDAKSARHMFVWFAKHCLAEHCLLFRGDADECQKQFCFVFRICLAFFDSRLWRAATNESKKTRNKKQNGLGHLRFIVCVTPKQKKTLIDSRIMFLAEHVRNSQSTIYLKSHGCVHGLQNEMSLMNFSTIFC